MGIEKRGGQKNVIAVMDHEGKEVEVELPPLFTLYKDGTVCRSLPHPLVPPSPEPAGPDGVASKDVTFNTEVGLWARLFLPTPNPHRKLPIVLYFHGGGFIFGSPAWQNFHDFCTAMALRSASIWISASYRLAPENRLPASLDDGFTALQWLHKQSRLMAEGKEDLMEVWLASHADFSKCFVAGESAGGTLAHHVAMRAVNRPLSSASWEPLCIRGVILIHPGFMSGIRTQEEIDCHQDHLMNWALADVCANISLPVGASSKDHPYFNPLPAICSSDASFVLPRTLVALADNDALHFMGLKYVRALKEAGCRVDLVMSKGVGHVFFIAQPESEQAEILMQSITSFITKEEH